MLLTPHLLVGVAIITNIQNPVLGLFLVFLSHYFLDIFPHKVYLIENIKNRRWKQSLPDLLKIFADIMLGLFIVFLTIGYNPFILLVIFLAILPDGITLLSCFFPKNKLFRAHQKIHFAINEIGENKKIPTFWRITSQVVVIIIAIYFLL